MSRHTTAIVLGACLSFTALFPALAAENEFADQMKKHFAEKIAPAMADSGLVEAIRAQNAKTTPLSDADIDRLDKEWRAQAKAGGGPLINEVLGNRVSAMLKALKESSGGVVSEIFVMDARGLNVGQSDVTSDYMQGDEPKHQKTFKVGPGAVFVDEVDFDESAKAFQAQISTTVVDPADGKVIGAVTAGLMVEKLP